MKTRIRLWCGRGESHSAEARRARRHHNAAPREEDTSDGHERCLIQRGRRTRFDHRVASTFRSSRTKRSLLGSVAGKIVEGRCGGGGAHLDLGRLEGDHVGDGGGDAGHFEEWDGGCKRWGSVRGMARSELLRGFCARPAAAGSCATNRNRRLSHKRILRILLVGNDSGYIRFLDISLASLKYS